MSVVTPDSNVTKNAEEIPITVEEADLSATPITEQKSYAAVVGNQDDEMHLKYIPATELLLDPNHDNLANTRAKIKMEEALKKMIEQQRDWMASQLSEQWKLMEEQVSRLANQLQDLQTQGSGSYQDNYGQGRNNICWDEFVMDLGARFKEDDHNDIVEEFNKLCQTGDLEEYVDKFEELKGLLLRKRPNMPQEYFLDSFIAGLKPQIKPFVKAFAPTSVTKAISYARLQEQTVEAWRTQDKSNKHSQLQSNMGRNNTPLLAKPESSAKSSTPTGYQGAFRPQGSYNSSSSANKPTFTQRNPKFIPASVRAEKIAKGLCYYCDKPFEKGHKCENRETQLFLVEVLGEEEAEQFELAEAEARVDNDPSISFHAISGGNGYQTMRVTGPAKKNNMAKTQFLVQWTGQSPEDATWEWAEELLKSRCKVPVHSAQPKMKDRTGTGK
ncbi:unnamed protein product [Cuscuta campestris]|uniref:Chromo domain-containing protein n=1 Tax=Cuscuta campestris TaxID=132261 RepID=A0A484NQC9_9ASTE|nr:unnamed protein product [Cuscuta campestris]